MRRLLLFVPLLLWSACDSEAPGSSLAIESVAFGEGTRWTYAYTLEQYGTRAGETRPDSLESVERDTVIVAVLNDDVSLGDLTGLIQVETTLVAGRVEVAWYRASDEALERVAYNPSLGGEREMSAVVGRRAHGFGAVLQRGWGECGQTADGMRYCLLDRPYRLYEYPLEVGQSWRVHDYADESSTLRTVAEASVITTPAGTFDTVTIRDEDNGLGILVETRVAREGRVAVGYAIEQVRTSEAGEELGLVRFEVREELIRLERP